jgi:ketosteroid isomerase-like protein
MNKIFLLITLVFLFSAVAFAQKQVTDASVLIKADEEFSDFSFKNGFANAFMSYADDSVIKLMSNNYPLIGKSELVKCFTQIAASNHSVLTWTPSKAMIAQSGDLGFTFGHYELRIKLESDKDTVYYGNYVSIWKKQKDGTWKYVLDGGNPTPAPPKKN